MWAARTNWKKSFRRKEVGPIDILVNNSATNIGQGPSLEITDEMLMKMVEINILAALRLVRLTVPKMAERGGGSVINIASIAGLRPQPGGLLYSFTKAGLIMMTRTWAVEFGPQNVRVNAIAPGLIQTDFSEFFWKSWRSSKRHSRSSIWASRTKSASRHCTWLRPRRRTSRAR